MRLFENFTDPLEFEDYHLAVFFAQLVILIVTVLLCVKFVFTLDEGKNNLEVPEGFFASIKYNLTTQEGEEKFLRKIPSLDSDEVKVATDKFIDIKNGGLWLTDRQDIMFTAWLLGVYFANVVLVFAGAGPIYKGIRSVIRIFTESMLPFFIFIIPFGIWGATVCIFLFLTGVVTMFLAPFNLLLHLVLGIIQSVVLIKNRI